MPARAQTPNRLRHRPFTPSKTPIEPDIQQKREQIMIRYSSLQRFLQEGFTHFRGKDIQEMVSDVEQEMEQLEF